MLFSCGVFYLFTFLFSNFVKNHFIVLFYGYNLPFKVVPCFKKILLVICIELFYIFSFRFSVVCKFRTLFVVSHFLKLSCFSCSYISTFFFCLICSLLFISFFFFISKSLHLKTNRYIFFNARFLFYDF